MENKRISAMAEAGLDVSKKHLSAPPLRNPISGSVSWPFRAVLVGAVLAAVSGCNRPADAPDRSSGTGAVTYTVTFDVRDTKTPAPEPQLILANEQATSPAPARAGFHLEGWFTSADAADKLLTATRYDFAAPVTKSFTLYAGWLPLDGEYTVADAAQWQAAVTAINGKEQSVEGDIKTYSIKFTANVQVAATGSSWFTNQNIRVVLKSDNGKRTFGPLSGGASLLTITNAQTVQVTNLTVQGAVNSASPLVTVASGGAFVLSPDGTVSGNKNTGNGGGVYVDGGTAEIAGTITDNEAALGGGVYIANGTLTMKGGVISNNTASNGAGVYLSDNAVFQMSDGIIFGNEAVVKEDDRNGASIESDPCHALYGTVLFGTFDNSNHFTPNGTSLSEVADTTLTIWVGNGVRTTPYTYGDSETPDEPVIPANFVEIPGGTFMMGQTSIATPVHSVTVSTFYMSKHEVTQKEWVDVMGSLPAGVNETNGRGDNYPVYSASWYDAVEYCNKLSEKENREPVYTISEINRDSATQSITSATVTAGWDKKGYRLPTEAEWEYACRAGTITAFWYGDTENVDYMWYSDNAGGKSHEVGTTKEKPNPWGLYDMHGNVKEWCWDWYGTYPNESKTDPKGADSGSYRVTRGGSWELGGQNLRSAHRTSGVPGARVVILGFRTVCPEF